MKNIYKTSAYVFGFGLIFLLSGLAGNQYVAASVENQVNSGINIFIAAIAFGVFMIILAMLMFLLAGVAKK